jgi:hypothetical protein
MKSVLICIPSYTGQVEADCMISVTRNIKWLENNGYEVGLHIESESCYLPLVRNRCVDSFLELKDKYDFLVFVDADLKFCDNAIFKLVKRDVDLIAGVYPFRIGRFGWCFQPETENDLIPKYNDGLIRAVYAPTGMMCIRRNVLESMKARYPECKSVDGASTLFDTGMLFGDGKWYGEDVAFCHRWRDMGGVVLVEPDIDIEHIGKSRASGNYLKHLIGLESKDTFDSEKEFADILYRLRSGAHSSGDFKRLLELWGNNHASVESSFLEKCYLMAQNTRGNIFETGSGITTIVMACAINGNQKITSIEDSDNWAGKLAGKLMKYGIDKKVNIVYSQVNNGWYDYRPNGEKYSLVLCDGPFKLEKRIKIIDIMKENIKEADLIIDDTNGEFQLDIAKRFAELTGKKVECFGRFATVK